LLLDVSLRCFIGLFYILVYLSKNVSTRSVDMYAVIRLMVEGRTLVC